MKYKKKVNTPTMLGTIGHSPKGVATLSGTRNSPDIGDTAGIMKTNFDARDNPGTEIRRGRREFQYTIQIKTKGSTLEI